MEFRLLRSLASLIAVTAALSLGVGAGASAPTATHDAVTITLLANTIDQPGYDAVIASFERAYPNIKVQPTYALSPVLSQLEPAELAAGNAPDLLTTSVGGCGASPISICLLVRAGDLAPLVKEPWAKRSLPVVTSEAKIGQTLYAFEPQLSAEGIFADTDLFKRLGLKVPQTFPQLLSLCQKAKSAGAVAIMLAGASQPTVGFLLAVMSVPTVYAKDKQWPAKQKAGKVTFAGSAGWHTALQHLIDMNNAGCFESGAVGTITASAQAQFAQGRGLMIPGVTSQLGEIMADNAAFAISAYPFPGGTTAGETRTFLNTGNALSVNAHSSAQKQSAARSFVDFVARPQQNALYASVNGGLTQYAFLKEQIPPFMYPYVSVFKQRAYVTNPIATWWNPNVYVALQQNGIGLITGQRSVGDVLNAMDAAWKLGPG
jgi:raffinose/stachyose/melibiose transport system substrate-binding protein